MGLGNSKNKKDKQSVNIHKDVTAPEKDNETRIFGIPLAVAATKFSQTTDEKNVPYPLYSSIRYLNEKCLNTVGLYRVPGNKRVTEEYRDRFDKGEMINFLDDKQNHDPHDVCGLVSLFMNSLPESIFSTKLRELFQLKQFNTTSEDDEKKIEENKELKIQRLQQLIWCDLYPEINRDTLRYFVRHLHLIDKNSENNKMTAKNIVISLFGVSPFSRTYYLLITNYERIFTKPEHRIIAQQVEDELSWLERALEEQEEEEKILSKSKSFIEQPVQRGSMNFAANRLSMSVDQLLTKGSDIRKSRRNLRIERDVRETSSPTITDTEDSIATPLSPDDKKGILRMMAAKNKPIKVDLTENEGDDIEERPIIVDLQSRQ
jgi:hypothetical protein